MYDYCSTLGHQNEMNLKCHLFSDSKLINLEKRRGGNSNEIRKTSDKLQKGRN